MLSSRQGATCEQHFPSTAVSALNMCQMQVTGHKVTKRQVCSFFWKLAQKVIHAEASFWLILFFSPETITRAPACRPALDNLQLHSAAAAADLRPGAAAAAVPAGLWCRRGGHGPLAAASSRLQGLWVARLKKSNNVGKRGQPKS